MISFGVPNDVKKFKIHFGLSFGFHFLINPSRGYLHRERNIFKIPGYDSFPALSQRLKTIEIALNGYRGSKEWWSGSKK